MMLSAVGLITRQCWVDIPKLFKNVELDEYVVMPNHVHGIIIINESDIWVQNIDSDVRVKNIEPIRVRSSFQHVPPGSIGSIIRAYKAAVTRECRRAGLVLFRWHQNYYEHIIRGEKDYRRIQEYIQNNPLQWSLKKEISSE